MKLSDTELVDRALRDLRELLGVSMQPTWHQVVRWNRAMPQYLVGHNDRLARIENSLANYPSLALAGNAYRGVGIPQCVRSGRQAAERIREHLRHVRPS